MDPRGLERDFFRALNAFVEPAVRAGLGVATLGLSDSAGGPQATAGLPYNDPGALIAADSDRPCGFT